MSDGSSALAVVESSSLEANVGTLMRRATDVAGVCREVVTKTAQNIQGRKYVRVEGWQSIAVAYGCVASSRDVEVLFGPDGKVVGVKAIGEVRRMSDGYVVSSAEGYVGSDEPTWFGGVQGGRTLPARPMYAIRAMAQTRAVSRACRGAFSFVVTLIDSNLSTTPAEEMEGIASQGSTEPPPPVRGNAALKAAMRPSPPKPSSEPPAHADADFRADPPHDAATGEATATHDRSFVMPFANKQNEQLHQLSEKSLRWFKNALSQNVADPAKARFRETAQQQLDLITAELAYRGL